MDFKIPSDEIFDIRTAKIGSDSYDLNDEAQQQAFLSLLNSKSNEPNLTQISIYDKNENVTITIDSQYGWIAFVIHSIANDCIYIPFNKAYKLVNEIAPVQYAGERFVYKRECFDEIEYVIDTLKHLFKYKSFPNFSELQWQKVTND